MGQSAERKDPWVLKLRRLTTCDDAQTTKPREWTTGLCRNFIGADARIRTADPFITSEVLYQLSYVGGERDCSREPASFLLSGERS